MEIKDIAKYFQSIWVATITPTIQKFAKANKDNSDTIVEAIKEIPTESTITNTQDIVDPLLEAQNATTQAVKDIPVQVFPEVNFDSLESRLDTINKTLEEKEMEVNIGATKLELKPVIDAIKKIKLQVPKMEKQVVIDYRDLFSEIISILEKPKDHKEIQKVQELLKPLSKTEDISIIAEWLEALYKKEEIEYPLNFDKDGKLLVKVDRVGGGGGGLTQDETNALLSTEEKQDRFGGYIFSDFDIESDPLYIGKIKDDGAWVIQEISTTSGTSRYAVGDTDYTTNWDDKGTLTYNLINEL